MVAFGSDAMAKVVVGVYYELCILVCLHSCQVEAWPDIYSRFLLFLLKIFKEESFEFSISLFTFVCLSTHFLQKSWSFSSFHSFILLCNTSDCCLVMCIAPSTFGFSKKPCFLKRRERKHQSIWNYLHWAICVQCSFWAKMIFSCLTCCNWVILFYELLTYRGVAGWFPHSFTNTEQSLQMSHSNHVCHA